MTSSGVRPAPVAMTRTTSWIISLTALLLVHASTGSPCPGNSTATGCYVLNENFRDWAGAEAECATLATSIGRPSMGHLATIPDTTAQTLIKTMVEDLITSKNSYAAWDHLATWWLGGFEESAEKGYSPLPLWRWITNGSVAVKHQGCFRDKTPTPELDDSVVYTDMTPEKCIDTCNRKGFPVAGVQGGNTCGCGNTYGSQGATGGCTSVCTGVWGTCGGVDRNAIYLINGSFVKWSYDQPNNFDDYQPCGHLERAGLSAWTMGDKTCHEPLSFICDIPGASCNHGSLGFYQVAGRCIYVHTSSRKSWFDARAICRQKGGDLAVVAPETTLTAVDDLLSNTLATSELFWIGLVGRQWMWADGQDLDFTHWSPSEPNDASKNCMTLASNQQKEYWWTDESCATKLPYICYIDMVTPLPSTAAMETDPPTTAIPAIASSDVKTTEGIPTKTSTRNPAGPPTKGAPLVPTTLAPSTTITTDVTRAPASSAEPRLGASTSGSGSPSWTIIVGVTIAILLVVIIALVGVCVWKKKKTKETDTTIHPDNGKIITGEEDAEPATRRGHRRFDEESTATTTHIQTEIDPPDLTSKTALYIIRNGRGNDDPESRAPQTPDIDGKDRKTRRERKSKGGRKDRAPRRSKDTEAPVWDGDHNDEPQEVDGQKSRKKRHSKKKEPSLDDVTFLSPLSHQRLPSIPSSNGVSGGNNVTVDVHDL